MCELSSYPEARGFRHLVLESLELAKIPEIIKSSLAAHLKGRCDNPQFDSSECAFADIPCCPRFPCHIVNMREGPLFANNCTSQLDMARYVCFAGGIQECINIHLIRMNLAISGKIILNMHDAHSYKFMFMRTGKKR